MLDHEHEQGGQIGRDSVGRDSVGRDSVGRDSVGRDKIEIKAENVYIGDPRNTTSSKLSSTIKEQNGQQKPEQTHKENNEKSFPTYRLPRNIVYPDCVYQNLPKSFPGGSNTFLSFVIIYIIVIVIYINLPILGSFLMLFSILATIIFLISAYLARREVLNRRKLDYCLEKYWDVWENRIENEITAKGYANKDDLYNLVIQFGIDINDVFGVGLDFLEEIFLEYERIHHEEVIYRYIYDKKTSKPVDFNENRSYSHYDARKILASRKKFPPGRYEYSIERRLVQK